MKKKFILWLAKTLRVNLYSSLNEIIKSEEIKKINVHIPFNFESNNGLPNEFIQRRAFYESSVYDVIKSAGGFQLVNKPNAFPNQLTQELCFQVIPQIRNYIDLDDELLK